MKPRGKRLLLALLLVAGVASGTGFILIAFEENLLYFYTPSQVASGAASTDRPFRIGGMVVSGSVHRGSNHLAVHFDVTDGRQAITVVYDGILPDLFREGQGIVADGRLGTGGLFQASRVLAKHDENYMPPEAAAALARRVATRPSAQGEN